MKIRGGIVAFWQRVPLSWRKSLVGSKLAPSARRLVNRFYPAGLSIFPLAAPLEGYRMRLNWRSSKALVFGTYESEVVHLLLEMVQPDWLVLDVGAHVGYFALLLAKLVGPRGKVVAFEPCPENFRVLEENVSINNCQNIVLENRAVAAATGAMTLRSNDNDQLTFTTSLAHGRPMIDVETVSLDDYVSELHEQINLVMMDVEGSEAAVLQGMRSLVRRDAPILLIELHGFDHWGQDHPALQELRRMDYDFRLLDHACAHVHILAEPRKAERNRERVVA